MTSDADFLSRSPRRKMWHAPRPVRLVMLIISTLIGSLFLVIGIVAFVAPPATTAICDNTPMSRGDLCRVVTYSGSNVTSDQELSYDQQLASQNNDTRAIGPWALGGGAIWAGLSGFGIVRWFRKRPPLEF